MIVIKVKYFSGEIYLFVFYNTQGITHDTQKRIAMAMITHEQMFNN